MAAAVITGGGSGIGRALAHALATSGTVTSVFVVGRRADMLEETAALASTAAAPAGPAACRIVPVCADVSTREGIAAVEAAVGAAPLRFLIHNAAVLGPLAPLIEIAREAWDGVLAVNTTAPLFLTQALLPNLRAAGAAAGAAAGGGLGDAGAHAPTATPARVLFISSGAAHRAFRGWGTYCTTKAAMHMVARMLALELAPLGVAVGSARPGVVDTVMQGLLRAASADSVPDRAYFVGLKEEKDRREAPAAAAAAEAAAAAAGASPRPPPVGALDTPENVARFLVWLLTVTSIEEFSSEELDIRDAKLHSRWG